MADELFFSSQGSEYERHKIFIGQENVASSPASSNLKPKRPPTVTPKRFNKFFTPRNTRPSRGGRQSKASRQLRDITKNGANSRRSATASHPFATSPHDENAYSTRPLKRRKFSVDLTSSQPQSSPLKRVTLANDVIVFEDAPSSPICCQEDDLVDLLEDLKPFPKPVKKYRRSGQSRDVLQRSFGGYDALSRGRRLPDHCGDWRASTADFYSEPDDCHVFTGPALPFCTASCNTNSLIATGEEEGRVRLIDSSPSSDFSTPHIVLRPHHNAVMDLAFSADDYMLATASGDQTARIIDMHTQQTICIMSGHTSSVKQVRFQPSDENVLATSSRDGSVQIWDMRCGGKGSVASLRTAFARNVDNGGFEPVVQYSHHTLQVAAAHRSTTTALNTSAGTAAENGVSITSINFLPNGRDHLVVTASEVNSSIKLWDLRNAGKRGFSVPTSSTSIPQSHATTRNYGINAMSWSTDGARFYATCRDGAVYTYSTNHLVLGCAPELDPSAKNRRGQASTKAGIGPLYAFRHPSLRMGSFYVKSAIRHAKDDKSEILAVGSSDGCAILFPTDERHLLLRERLSGDEEDADYEMASLPMPLNPVLDATNDTPSSERGTPLIRGHDKEVTSLTWTYDGELVTVSDDFTARCWREDGAKARELRSCGEAGGRRWRCGWARVDATLDEEDC